MRETAGPDASTASLAAELGLDLMTQLPARSGICWQARRGEKTVVLRRHLDPFELGADVVGRSVVWQLEAARLAADRGWPVPRGIGDPLERAGSWWTLETFLPGEPRAVDAATRARLIADWHATDLPLDRLGRRAGVLNHLAILADPGAEGLLRRCADPTDRSWLLRRMADAVEAADGVDWSASRQVLVHGDLTPWNLLWDGEQLSGLLDLELSRIDRRITEMTLSWRCRYDDLVLGLDRLDPLGADEWRMLLVDWWALLLTLAASELRRGRQPDRWTLDGLRRESPLSLVLLRDGAPPRRR